MSGKRAMIIGASRGIGLGLARELSGRGWQVVASRRSEGGELDEVAGAASGRVEPVIADVTDDGSIAALVGGREPGSFDALVLNAGVYGPADQSIMALGREDVADILMTNAIGPARAACMLLPLLRDRGVLGFMTSEMGSIAGSSGGANHYRMSKVAQNMLARSVFEQHARERGIAVLSLHPGWVRTDMGGPNALISVEESARGLADVIEEPREPCHVFLGYNGAQLPW